jgi:hypothetical protein
MKNLLSFAAAFAAVVAMSASADAKSGKRHHAKDQYMRSAAGSSGGMQSQQMWGGQQAWGWNSSYVFKGDRYDYPAMATRAPMSGKGRSAN